MAEFLTVELLRIFPTLKYPANSSLRPLSAEAALTEFILTFFFFVTLTLSNMKSLVLSVVISILNS